VRPRLVQHAHLEGNRRETVFGWVEGAALLNLNAGLELREVKKIAPVDGEVLNLVEIDRALHRGLLRIDGDRASLNFNDLALLSEFHLKVSGCSVANLNGDCQIHGLEALALHPHDVVPGLNWTG